MKQNLFLIPNFITTILSFVGQIAFAQSDMVFKVTKPTTYIYYALSGLGSNMGKFEPTIKIIGTKFVYTYEQNSYFGTRSKEIKKISIGAFRQSSIDSIIDLVKNLKDSTIFKSNICVMSGCIHFLTVTNGMDTTKFELMNTFDSSALKIVTIINEYLPENKKLLADEKFLQKEQDCWKYLRDFDKKQNKTDSIKKTGTQQHGALQSIFSEPSK